MNDFFLNACPSKVLEPMRYQFTCHSEFLRPPPSMLSPKSDGCVARWHHFSDVALYGKWALTIH
jgi:hypothetical protein